MEKELYMKEMAPGIWLMDEAHEATGYLVIGEEKACVIDTMNGYNDLYQAVRRITDKPLTVINTHGHPDHIFGNIYFDRAFLHPADLPLARSFIEEPALIWAKDIWRFMNFPVIRPEGSFFCFGRIGSFSPATASIIICGCSWMAARRWMNSEKVWIGLCFWRKRRTGFCMAMRRILMISPCCAVCGTACGSWRKAGRKTIRRTITSVGKPASIPSPACRTGHIHRSIM